MLKCCSFNEMIETSSDRLVINTTSTSDTWSRNLSPFYLKTKSYDNIVSCVENVYQSSKVYKCHLDSNNEPNKEWYIWRTKILNSKKPIRYPMGKGSKPEYLYWDGNHYGYLDSRRKIYAPLYGNAVQQVYAYQRLIREYIRSKDNGFDIYLKDFDAYDFHSMNKSFEQCLDDPNMKFGHSFVLYYLLRKDVDNITDIKEM